MSPDALADRVHRRLLEERPDEASLLDRIGALALAEAPLLDEAALTDVVDLVAARTVGLGRLDAVLLDDDISEVMVNGDGSVWIESRGTLRKLELRLSRAETELVIERVVAPLGRRVDRAAPYVDARLPDGSRVNVVVPPLAVDGPCVTIRRFGARMIPLEAVATPGVAGFLRWAVRSRSNILVSGGTGAGKTTLLNALAAAIPAGERIITVEDAAELRLPLEHVVRLEARPPNVEGAGEIRVRDLVRNALRMRPDRIVVGEVRGAEALDMLQAMNTGHEGSLSTVHANGTADALRRVETMVLSAAVGLPLTAVREQIASAIDLVVHVARASSGERRVVAVDEVAPLGSAGGSRPLEVHALQGSDGLAALPSRPARRAGEAPDRRWLAS
jgi:pilus assembly protein CpaF